MFLQYDVDNLKKLFEALLFSVEVQKNPSKPELDTILTRFSRDQAHWEADMMIMAILSHGRDGHVYTSDGRMNPTERIYEKFNNQNCQALKGKPKFFIIQVRA